jgi:hypothetical protein
MTLETILATIALTMIIATLAIVFSQQQAGKM